MKQRPYTIIIDSSEQRPFFFKDIKGDSRDQFKDLIIPTTRRALGRCRADYALEGFEGSCHIERKSIKDCQATVLGFSNEGDLTSRRDRFEEELKFLSEIETGAVVVEGTLEQVLSTAPEYGKKTAEENTKTLYRQILAWMNDFRCPWVFAWSRRAAELTAFHLIDRFWRKNR